MFHLREAMGVAESTVERLTAHYHHYNQNTRNRLQTSPFTKTVLFS